MIKQSGLKLFEFFCTMYVFITEIKQQLQLQNAHLVYCKLIIS